MVTCWNLLFHNDAEADFMKFGSFNTGVLWHTVWVYDPLDPGGLYSHITKQHCNQGFVWRPGCVGFFVETEEPDLSVEIWMDEAVQLASDVVRAIQLPFKVGQEGIVICGGDGGKGTPVVIPVGSYALTFENGYLIDPKSVDPIDVDMLPMWCRLWFNRQDHVEPKILVQDAELSPTYPLCMQAEIIR